MANLRANKIVSTTGSNAITGSVEFDGTGDYLSLSNVSDFRMGSDDFTVECWIYPTSSGANKGIVGIWNSTSGRTWLLYNNSSLQPVFILDGDGVGGGEAQITGNVIALNQWTHLAGVRYGANMFLYVNGVNVGTTAALTVFNNTSDPLEIGRFNSANDFQGFISNVRVIKGTALYTQNFIPPTAELRNVPGTVLLCCQNPSSATQEATGKTITVNGNATARNFTPRVGSDGTVTFDGVTKISTENYFYLPTGNTEDRGRGRGVFGGGYTPYTNTIDYIQIQSQGIAQDFGDLFTGRYTNACSSSTRGLFGGGYTSPGVNTNMIDYVTISSTGNASDFGDLFETRRQNAGCSSSTRGLFGGGRTSGDTSTIDFITIASIGNASDFGDLTEARRGPSSCSSNTRGVWGGGVSSVQVNTVDYVTIASTGNALDFGDLTQARRQLGGGGCSSSTRGVFGGGTTPTIVNTIDYITIASTGNASDFGDLTQARSGNASCSSSIRGVFAGGYTPTIVNTIDFIVITSTGNASDFGDLTLSRYSSGGLSDSHGGLG